MTRRGEYYGDSGGPLFLKMPDNSWRLVGTDSGSPDIVAGSTTPRFSIYANAPYFLEWAERVTGLDLTPCLDEGVWRPNTDCVEFPNSIASETDGWANDCRGQSPAELRPTCEALGAGGTGAGGANASDRSGMAGESSPTVQRRADSPAHGSRLDGGACIQAPCAAGALPSLVASLAILTGFGWRRSRDRRW